MKVLIVGAGPTGALVASLLSKSSLGKQVTISIWEKSRGCGGRMATTRLGDANSAHPHKCSVDTGAQYISSTPAYQTQHHSIYEELVSSKVLEKMSDAGIDGQKTSDPNMVHFMSGEGLSSIAKHLIKGSGAELCLGKHLDSISPTPQDITAHSLSGQEEQFDAVVITIPVPQILKLGGVQQVIGEDQRSVLEKVTYSSRFALAIKLPDDFEPPVEWTASYITDNPCVRFVCLDTKKRNLGKPHTLLVHTSVLYGIKHLEEEKENMTDNILLNLRQALPWIPEKAELVIKPHKWRYSQVQHGVEGEPGYMTISDTPPIVLCGDAFTHSNLDGCISSALKTTEVLRDYLKGHGRTGVSKI